MKHDVRFLDQHGGKHFCDGVEAVDELAAAKDAAARLSVRYDAVGCRKDGDAWILPKAKHKAKSSAREDLRLVPCWSADDDAKPAIDGSTPSVDRPSIHDEKAAIGERVRQVEDKWGLGKGKPAGCSVAGCTNEWTGARIDPETGSPRWFCRVHNVLDWWEIRALDRGGASAAASPEEPEVFESTGGGLFDHSEADDQYRKAVGR